MIKKIGILSLLSLVIILSNLFISCSDDPLKENPVYNGEGVLLELGVSFDLMTKALPLPNTNAINDAGTNSLNNIGLYIYYQTDYNSGDLSKPYVRNLECEVDNGKIVPVLANGEDPTNADIYIYDEMVIVAFYPYNPDMSLEQNFFTTKADEEKYPITRLDYSQQTYIPYRGQVSVNPTTAFYREVVLYPKHTFKIEIILVSDNISDFDDSNPDIKVLPDMDPVDNTDPTQGTREKWYDIVDIYDQSYGGSNVRRYTAYIWQTEELDHMIRRNDVLFENGDFTLLASEDVNIVEQRVYRYGYNLTNGEVFIPTSSNLVYDAPTLQAANGVDTRFYQVCDVDLEAHGNFTPLSLINATYDGGGHKISNLSINSFGEEVGLFRQILGNSYLKNINLIDPVITVNSTADTCYVGALCGVVNDIPDDTDMSILAGSISLPPNLSEVVREALLSELLGDILNSTSQVIACRVENPQITVNGTYPRVGTVCGMNGDRADSNTFKGIIWDTYSLGGTLSVNSGNPANNEGAEVGGFCGLNEFYITRCYTTIEESNIDAEGEEIGDDGNGNPVTNIVDIWEGFANQGTLYTSGEGAGIANCYAEAPDSNGGVTLFSQSRPSGWVQYTGIWPINTSGWTSNTGNSFWYNMGNGSTEYPTLQWERR